MFIYSVVDRSKMGMNTAWSFWGWAVVMLRWPVARFLFFVLLLLNAQLGVAVHAAEHPFHEHAVSCDVFAAAQPGQGLCGVELSIALEPVAIEPCCEPLYHFLSPSVFVYFSRAPPLAV